MQKATKRWIALILSALLVFSAASCTAEDEDLIRSRIDEGLAAWNNGDYQTAAEFLLLAAEAGSDVARNYLGVMYFNGIGVTQSCEIAMEYWEQAAAQGNVYGFLNLAGVYEYGMGVEQSYEKAAEYFRAAADLGDLTALAYLGLYYERGWGVEQSLEKAAEYYRLCADRGDPSGQIYLGLCYRDEKGVEQTYEKAMEYFRLAADGSDDPVIRGIALSDIASLYEKGQGVEQSYETAAEYYRAGAELGDCYSQDRLGLFHELGNGVEQSWEKAAEYYQLAADQAEGQQYPDPLVHLAHLYKEGLGVEQSTEKALDLWAHAVRLGSEEALQEVQAFAEANHYGLEQTEGIVIPDYTKENVRQFELPDTEAMRFARKLKAGWNLGNTFDAYWQGSYTPDDYETWWSGAKTTPPLIRAIREAGFNVLRIPVSWHNHLTGGDYSIDPAWLARVQEVAGWAVSEEMYVIINIHHDNSPEYLYPDPEHCEQSERYIAAIWSQVAAAFAEYDEHIIFESMNEPRLVGTDSEWDPDPQDPEVKDAMLCINRLNRKFVETVRASGGSNAGRWLMIPGYCGSAGGACADEFELPADDRLIIEAHGYIPYDFALNLSSPDSSFDLEKDGAKKNEVGLFLNRLYEKFVRNGIPVIIDEFGALYKTEEDLQARVNYTAFFAAMASARGIPVVWWDNSCFTGDGEKFGLIDRNRLQWVWPDIALALVRNCTVNRGE